VEKDFRGAVIFIEPDVVEAAAVGIEWAAAARVLDTVVKIALVGKPTHAQRIELRSLVAIAPEQKAVIGRTRGIGQVEVALALGLTIAVEQLLFLAPVTRRAEKARVLAALAIGRAVGVGAVLHWDGGSVLLDAFSHFSDPRALKLLGVGHERL